MGVVDAIVAIITTNFGSTESLFICVDAFPRLFISRRRGRPSGAYCFFFGEIVGRCKDAVVNELFRNAGVFNSRFVFK